MKSRTPKVLHTLSGRSLLGHAIAAAGDLAPQRLVVVVGHAREEVGAAAVAAAPQADIVVQEQQLGTGHAVRMVIESVGAMPGTVVVTYGDMPLLRGRTLVELASRHAQAGNAVTVLTARGDFPGFGRIVRDADGAFLRIVEERDATEAELAIDEFNSGCYAFDGALLADAIKRVTTEQQPARGVPHRRGGDPARRRAPGRHRCSPPSRPRSGASTTGSSSRRRGGRSTTGYSPTGCSPGSPSSTRPPPGSTPPSRSARTPRSARRPSWRARTVIGAGARIGPGCLLEDTTVGEDAVLLHAVCRQSQIGPRVTVGPFAYLRPGAAIGDGAHIGTYVELKKAHVGAGREGAAPHLRRRRDHRQRVEHRRGNDLRQLRRGAQAPHRDRRERLRRQQHRARGAGHGRRRRLHGGRVGDHSEDVPAGDLGVAGGAQHNSDGWVLRNRRRVTLGGGSATHSFG